MRYDVDPERSQIWIGARSSVHPVNSESRGLSGYVDVTVDGAGQLEPGVVPTARLELPVDRLSSGNPLYDREMRRRVDARRFPTISGALHSLRRVGAGRYAAEGDVTFRGVTRRVADELTVSVPEEGSLVLEGEHVFDVREFDMEPPRILMLRVHPEVRVRVRVVAERR